jgi:hypothetical protein
MLKTVGLLSINKQYIKKRYEKVIRNKCFEVVAQSNIIEYHIGNIQTDNLWELSASKRKEKHIKAAYLHARSTNTNRLRTRLFPLKRATSF